MKREQIMGGLMGVVIGDALGLPVQFTSREERRLRPVKDMEGWGTFNMPPGSFSDDGSLTLCLMESIVETGITPEEAARLFLRWYNEGYWTPAGFAYDIGGSTSQAMENLKRGKAAIQSGPKGERDNGNGSLMRILPAAIYLAGEQTAELAQGIWQISRITHGHPRACSACYIYALLVRELLSGADPRQAYAQLCNLPEDILSAGIATSERVHFARVLGGSLHEIHENEIKSSGYVVDTLEAALWCLLLNHDYASTVLAAVNMGEDTDTVAAVVGGLAGIAYGLNDIPEGWRQVLVRGDEILALSKRLADLIMVTNINDARETTVGSRGISMLDAVIKYQELFQEDESSLYYTNGERQALDSSYRRAGLYDFIQALYKTQFLLNYDWMNRGLWGEFYLSDMERLGRADLLTLRLLLSAVARNDRFCEGYLESLMEEGKLKIIMKRLVEIHTDLVNGRRQWRQVDCGPEPDEQIEYLYLYQSFERMYWVEPGRLLAGGYPGDLDTEKATVKLTHLVSSGVGQVICLMEENEPDHHGQPFRPYEQELQELSRQAGRDIIINRLPIKDLNVPTEDEMKHILDLIDQALEEDRIVYVHCWGGTGRTGTVVGCCLVRHGTVSGSQALELIPSLRRDVETADRPSPETREQRAMVRHWKAGS